MITSEDIGLSIRQCLWMLVALSSVRGMGLDTDSVANVSHAGVSNCNTCLQASILEEQVVPALVEVLDGGPVSAGTAASVWALM